MDINVNVKRFEVNTLDLAIAKAEIDAQLLIIKGENGALTDVTEIWDIASNRLVVCLYYTVATI